MRSNKRIFARRRTRFAWKIFVATLAITTTMAACAPRTTYWSPAQTPKTNKVDWVSHSHTVRPARAVVGLSTVERERLDRFPGLADVPILGALFRSDKFQRQETELVIIVTPYIVRPVSNQQIALPTDGLTPPTDTDRVLYSRLYRPTQGRRPSGPNGRGASGLVGPVGFMLD